MKRILTIGVIGMMIVTLYACGKSESKKDDYELGVKDFITSYAKEYTVQESAGDDGKTTIVVTAPDFHHYLGIFEDREGIDLEELKTAIQKDSDPVMKDYRFQVNEVDETVIREAYLDRICYDILSSAIIDIK